MRPGDVLDGRFEIERAAGSGGMGQVFRARDRQSGEGVAIKALLVSLAAEMRPRFEQEAKALAELSHPGIVRYIANGLTPSGEPYLAMEWLEGEDLSARLERGRLSVSESAAVVAAAAEALGEAHARGVVHRDVKPSNIFLVSGDVARVKVLDFGIAKRDVGQRLTRTQAVLGTPGYMAPEQARSSRSADARADVFALGCVLYECLTGEPAFQGDNVLAVLVKVMFEEPRPLGEIVPDVPAALSALTASMLAKHPDARPLSGAAVAAALRALSLDDNAEVPLAHRPVASRIVSRGAETVPDGASALTGNERRVLSIVLARDVRPATAAASAATMSAADADAIQQALFWTAKSYEGQIELLADGSIAAVLAGARIASDQAARAALCALTLRERLPERRIALATGFGEVGGRLPTGAVIDRAAAMLALETSPAAEGSPAAESPSLRPPVAIDHVTAGLLDARFKIQNSHRGIELLGEREGAEEHARTLLGRRTPFVGRHRELALLEALFAECLEESVARAAVVRAPAGMGKSRLGLEFVAAARRRGEAIEVWSGRGDALAAGSAFGLLGQAVRGACGIRASDPLKTKLEKLRARVAVGTSEPERRRVTAFLGELIGAPALDEESAPLRAARRDPQLMADQLRRAWETFLAAESARRPVLIVLEDLHYGDVASVRALDASLESVSDKPWMVVALARLEVRDLFPKLWASRGCVEVSLSELAPSASRRLVEAVLGDAVDRDTALRLASLAAGNAFYLEELIRAAAERRGEALPETVLAMVQARFDGLSAESRRVLRAASVFGETSWSGAILSLLGGSMSAQELRRTLASLVEQEVLVRQPRARFPGEEELAFRHALLREGAYAMLTSEDRALAHRLAGAWLEERGEDNPIVLAEHFARGGELALAAASYLRAAEQALRAGDGVTAAAHAERGLACGAQGDARIALLGILCESLAVQAWRKDGTSDALARADEVLGAAMPGSVPWCRAFAVKCIASMHLGRADEVGSVLRAAAAAVTPEPGAIDALTFALLLGVAVLLSSGRYDLAAPIVERVREIAAPILPSDPLTRARIDLHFAYREAFIYEDFWGALAWSEEAMASCQEVQSTRGVLNAQMIHGAILGRLGVLDRAEEELRKSLVLADQMGPNATLGPLHLTGVLADKGAPDQARAEAARILEAGRARGSSLDQGRGRLALAYIFYRSGELDAALEEARAALELLVIAPGERTDASVIIAAILLAQARAPEALSEVEVAVQTHRARRVLGVRMAMARLVYAKALFAVGRRDEAAHAVLDARSRLMASADRILDPELRRSFLERVPENARTLALDLNAPSDR